MKTETTLRTARNSLLCFFMALGAGFLVACGGGGGGGGGVSSGNGSFHAKDWVVGLDYTYNGGTGKTGERGAFSFPKGQTVAFSIGQVMLGSFVSNADEDFVTPTRIADSGPDAIRIERLLIALDSDGIPTNGTITLNADSATDATVVWGRLTVDNAETGVIELPADEVGGVTVARSIPTAASAEMFLTNTNNCAFSGAFEGKWSERRLSDGRTLEGDHALVLLAFDRGALSTVHNSLGTVSAADVRLDEIINDKSAGALYIELWQTGGDSQTPVRFFGSDSGTLSIALNSFPITRTITETETRGTTVDMETTTLRLESYDRISYESTTRRRIGSGASTVYLTESGYYRRVNEEVRDADYRIAGFYSDENNGETPVAEAEIGIYAFAANEGEGERSVRPYVGWFSSPLEGADRNSVYTNIGEGGLSSQISYTGTPGAGPGNGMMVVTDVVDSDQITVSFMHSTRTVEGEEVSNGYGTFQDVPATTGTELLGGWCAL